MKLHETPRPTWLTFDCYGTLIDWDEGLVAVAEQILRKHGRRDVRPRSLIEPYDRLEHELEQTPPYRPFATLAAEALHGAMSTLGLVCDEADVASLIDGIPAMAPFGEVPDGLRRLKRAGFRTCIVSNTDDPLIAGNVAQLPEGTIDRVVTAQQAGAYKPDRRLFDHAWSTIGVGKADVVHICASPSLDHAAARDVGFRCVWIDRGTGRKPLDDYAPDATVPTLDAALALFGDLQWMKD